MAKLLPEDEVGSKPAANDRIIIWPVIFIIVMLLAWAAIVGFFPVFLFALVLMGVSSGIPLVAIALIAGIVAIRSLRRGAWRRALSLAILPVFAVFVCLYPEQISQELREIGDRSHFYLMRRHYLAQAMSTAANGEPRLLVWNWGGMVWSSKGVVYDESDQIALPAPAQSDEWKARASRSELACGDYGFEPLGNHFYLAYFPC